MKIALVGSSGYIARYLLKRFSSIEDIDVVLKIGRNKNDDYTLDLAFAERFNYSVLEDVDYIIFTAAVSSPDKCAEQYKLCWKMNVEGTSFFIQKAMGMGCRVLFFSSDAVYGNMPEYIYSEKSETRTKMPYGKMKKAVEDKFKENHLFKALRLSYVVSAKDRFVSYCLQCMQNRRIAEVFHPLYRNCITMSDVGTIVIWLINNWSNFPDTFLNAAGEEFISRVRIADEINRFMNNKLIFKIVFPEYTFFLYRPEYIQMESLYLYTYNILERNSFSQKIQIELEDYIHAGRQ